MMSDPYSLVTYDWPSRPTTLKIAHTFGSFGVGPVEAVEDLINKLQIWVDEQKLVAATKGVEDESGRLG